MCGRLVSPRTPPPCAPGVTVAVPSLPSHTCCRPRRGGPSRLPPSTGPPGGAQPHPEQPSAPPLLWAGLGAALAAGTPRSPHVCWFRAVGPSCPWRRFVSPGGCPSARALRLVLYRCPGSRRVAGPAHP